MLQPMLHWPVMDTVSPLKAGEIQLWCCPLHFKPDSSDSIIRMLSADERQRASRFRTPVLRGRYIASRALLRKVLGWCTGRAPETLEFARNASGKPELIGNLHCEFNLAHSGELMLLATTEDTPVGVDMECLRPLKNALGIAERFFSANELAWLREKHTEEFSRAFFQLWTRKEAVLKATGEGITGGLNTFELIDSNGALAQATVKKTKSGQNKNWTLQELHPALDYVGALAIPEDLNRFQIKEAAFLLD